MDFVETSAKSARFLNMDGFEDKFEDLANKGYAYRKKRLEAEALARKQ